MDLNFLLAAHNFFYRYYTASEALDILLEDTDDFSEATITLLPPGDGHNSDEDSGDEDQFEFNNLPRRQMISRADLEINFGSHEESTIEDVQDVVKEPRRSARFETSNDNVCSFDVSGDLWADEQSLENETPTLATPDKWLSNQTPPSPPTTWKKRDINPKDFVDPPVPKNECVDKITPFGIFNFFFDDEVVDYIVKMTNLYATREKGIMGFRTNNNEIRTFLAILLLSGYNNRPRLRMYLERRRMYIARQSQAP